MDSESANLNLAIAQDKLHRQNENIKLITTKASILFAACVLFVANMNTNNWWVIIIFLASGFMFLYVVWPRKYNEGPKIDRVNEILKNHEKTDSILWLVEVYQQCANANSPKISRNAYAINLGMILLGIGVIFNLIIQPPF